MPSFQIDIEELDNLQPKTSSLVVGIRLRLEREGFKFMDSGKVGAIVNETPVPLGKFTCWEDLATHTYHFKQEL